MFAAAIEGDVRAFISHSRDKFPQVAVNVAG
jgi:hypothetical protein